MPDTVPGLTFDESGVCQFCKEYQESKPLGRKALDAVAKQTRNDRLPYDCLVPLSGGRDSTFALYFAKNILKRKVLAVSFDNEFQTPEAMKNMSVACERLGVEFKSIGSRKGYFKKIVKETLKSAPSLKQLSVCRACDVGIKSVVYRTALKHKIPLIIWGESQYEKTMDMTPRALNALRGLRSRYWKLLNPRFYLGEIFMFLFRRELGVPGNSSFSRRTPVLRDPAIKEVRLYDYIQWDREQIKNIIQNELGWTKPDDAVSTWKIDCSLFSLVNYEFFMLFGCSKAAFGYNRMINSKNMSRKIALEQEQYMKEHCKEYIPELLTNTIGLSKKEAKRILELHK